MPNPLKILRVVFTKMTLAAMNGVQKRRFFKRFLLAFTISMMTAFVYYEVTSFSVFKREMDQRSNKVSKVIIWAYPRSGSTFVGELLTSSQPAFYVFEPLYTFRKESLYSPRKQTTLTWLGSVVGNILDCEIDEIYNWNFEPRLIRGVSIPECEHQTSRVVKLVRGMQGFLQPWLKSRNDVKVIHLMRDPRGIRNSMEATLKSWSLATLNTTILCRRMRNDLKMKELLGPDRYMMVKYEHLIKNLNTGTEEMMKFMGVDYNDNVKTYIKTHIGNTGYRKSTYDTHRGDDFDPNTWKKNLPKALLADIQSNCEDVLRELNYEILDL